MATLNTPYAILAFPSLFQPRPRFGGVEQLVYQATLIFPVTSQKSPAYKAMTDAVIAQAQEGFGAQTKMNAVTMPFKDAGEKSGQWQGFDAGSTYIKTWSTNKPGIVDAQRNEILLPEEVWAGQMVRANVTPKFWVNSGKKGVSFYLNHIQVVRSDLPRIDGKASATKAFDDGEILETAGEDIFG
jgi:hypothetical protein